MRIIEQVYTETFDAIYNDLINKMNTKYYTRKDIEGLLLSLYHNEGSSLSGKSEIQHAKLSAAIAAHEAILVIG